MNRLNFPSLVMRLFYPLFVLSFFHIGFDDLQILVVSGSIVSLAFLSLVLNYKKESLDINPIIVLMFACGLAFCLPVFFKLVQSTAQYGLFQCGAWFAAFFLIITNNNFQTNWQQFKKLIYGLGLIFSLWAITQHYVYHYMASGPFAMRNTNGAFLMLVALMLCSEFLSAKQAINKSLVFFYSVLFFIVNLSLLLSFSRGVYLSYGLALLFLFGCNGKGPKAKGILLLLLLVVCSLIFFYCSAGDAIQHRIELLAQEKSRLVIWKGAWNLWLQSPWLGIGIENFKYYYPAFSLPGDGSTLENAHNDYLQLLIETGVPGIILIISLILSFFYSCWHYLRKTSASSSSYASITTQMAMLSALAMYACVDFVFYLFPMNLMLGILLGILYQNLASQGCIPQASFSLKPSHQRFIASSLCLGFLLIVGLFLNLFRYSYYTMQASEHVNQGRLIAATSAYNHAKHYFNSPYTYNSLASIYLERAKKTSKEVNKIKFIAQAEDNIAKTIMLHPYNAEPYFQRGIISALYYKDNAQAQIAFETFIKLKPQANFERLTFCYFLLEQEQLLAAQRLLEKGLLYPIDSYYAPKYLELLANLRLRNGDLKGAEQLADAIMHIESYRADFSALAGLDA